jgi:hypothetical protein
VELCQTVELACVNALGELLQGTELLVADAKEGTELSTTRASISSDLGDSLRDEHQHKSQDLKSRLFSKYFHVLSYVLASCDKLPIEHVASTTVRALEQGTVIAMSNLLHSNAHIGFAHFRTRASAFDENDDVRAAFLHVFTDLLRRRAKFAGMAEQTVRYDQALEELKDLLLSPDLSLVQLLCSLAQGREAEELGCKLVTIFERHGQGQTLRILEWLIQQELQDTYRIGTIFRGETMTTKMMSVYFQRYGREFLQQTVGVSVRNLIARTDLDTLDPSAQAELTEEQIASKMERLKNIASEFLESITQGAEDFPLLLRHLCAIIRAEANRRFTGTPGLLRVAVGGYVFLRFLCPAVAMPWKFKLTDYDAERNKYVKKALVSVARVRFSRKVHVCASFLFIDAAKCCQWNAFLGRSIRAFELVDRRFCSQHYSPLRTHQRRRAAGAESWVCRYGCDAVSRNARD